MKICMPTEGDKGISEKLYAHFGSAPYFTVVDTETGDVSEIIPHLSGDWCRLLRRRLRHALPHPGESPAQRLAL